MTAKKWPNQKTWRLKIAEIIDEELKTAGFEKINFNTHVIPLSEGISGIICMRSGARNHLPDASVTIVTPILGIRHEELERMFGDCYPGRKPTGDHSWTFWQYFNWWAPNSGMAETEIKKDEGREGSTLIIDELVSKMKAVGEPFWKSLNSIDDFVLAMQENEQNKHSLQCLYAYKFPLALVLVGREREAIEMVEYQEKNMETLRLARPFYSQYYRKFMTTFAT